MSLIAVLLGAVGAILSVFKSRWCFVIWIPVNLYWTRYNAGTVQAWVFVVMTVSCVAGWVQWGRHETFVERVCCENAVGRKVWTMSNDTVTALISKNEAKDKALKTHAHHLDDCRVIYDPPDHPEGRCTCGLDDALKG